MSGRVALITGASQGIGRAVARGLIHEGYRVVVAARREEPLHNLLEEVRAEGKDAMAVVCDVTDEGSVDTLFDRIRTSYGRLDILFNNAGVGAPAVPIDELDVASWRRAVDTNLTGSFLCSRAAFKMMRNQSPRGGRIINNGSVSSQVPRLFSAPYTATKHGISGLTKSIALDGRGFDITCSQIDIGNAETQMTERMTKGALQANGELAPEPRMDVQHVVDAVRYIAGLPLEANVPFMTIMATKMPLLGRG
eukprot:TRINITY_DN4442_c0_g1_i1.p1 TRINITY_DN4442_c0_g1~~TRINITY_DN4442_c0_g1_i1.p1  ORF type:complete len:261 (+),score=47.68 TRINITY_DN4442_c0_g1_i1:31-783(+)